MYLKKGFSSVLGLALVGVQFPLSQEASLPLAQSELAARSLIVCDIDGTAQLRPGGDDASVMAVETGQLLRSVGDTLTTYSDALVRVGVDDYLGRVSVLEDTQFTIESLIRGESSNTTQLRLEQGALHVAFYRPHIDAKSIFTVTTPDVNVTVLGQFLPAISSQTEQEEPLELLTQVKDNRASFCGGPIEAIASDDLEAWRANSTLLLDTDTVAIRQVDDGVASAENVPNFLVTVGVNGETEIIVDSESGPIIIEDGNPFDANNFRLLYSSAGLFYFDPRTGVGEAVAVCRESIYSDVSPTHWAYESLVRLFPAEIPLVCFEEANE